jgi:predicted ATP-grasp superfamily ATP-dependent carboligase
MTAALATIRTPVIVMNPFYSGLGIARSLRGTGVPVHALTSEANIPGARSRYFEKVWLAPNGRDEPEALCHFLVDKAREFQSRPVLFPTRDLDVIFLERYNDALAPGYLLPQSRPSPILRMMDKLELAGVASKLQLPTPQTAMCRSASEVEQICIRMPFPLIAKPRFAYQWRSGGMWEKVGAQKAFVARTSDELRQLYNRLAPSAPEVLLQEYIPGQDADIVVCCVYMGRDGEPKGYFTGRKIRQSPPLVGTGSVVEARECSAIIEPTMTLLKAFAYAGIAEVEYKYDRKRNTYFLIEINPRHWDQHELGRLAGVNITWLAYADMIGLPQTPTLPAYDSRSNYRWIAEPELARDLGKELVDGLTRSREGGEARGRLAAISDTLKDARELLAGRKIFAYASLADPLPGLHAGWRLAIDAWRASLNRARRVRAPDRATSG